MQSGGEPEESLEQACHRLRAGEFAFLDAGCSAGGSIAFCEQVFKKAPGIGIDASEAKVAKARAAGHAAFQADLASVDLPPGCVHFVSLLDFLEHLPDLVVTRTILGNMAKVARDFLYIRHPSFEDVAYLASHGLKLDWTDWHGHRNMMKVSDFDRLAHELGLPAPTIIAQKPISDSSHRSIVPIDAPRDTVGYEAAHGPKPDVRFDRPVYTQFDVFYPIDRRLTESAWFRITACVIGLQSTMIQRGDGFRLRGAP
ncbi:class I SAM-dependent methyltransferase [Myxococcota bacterium]|nr:class I SAM-dependent methyltransferase [Myxococcota bacterium]